MKVIAKRKTLRLQKQQEIVSSGVACCKDLQESTQLKRGCGLYPLRPSQTGTFVKRLQGWIYGVSQGV